MCEGSILPGTEDLDHERLLVTSAYNSLDYDRLAGDLSIYSRVVLRAELR